MDNLPPQLQSRLINLNFCIRNQSQGQSLAALEELTSLLSNHYQCFQKAHAALQEIHSNTQTRKVEIPYFLQEKNNAQSQTQQKTRCNC